MLAALAIKRTDTIPQPRPVQLGVFDCLVDREQIANDIRAEPMSERAILRETEGDDSSGHKRSKFRQQMDEDALWLFEQAQREFDFDTATLILFKWIARAPLYMNVAPDWILELFVWQKELLFEVFHNHRDDRRPQLGDSESDEDEAERKVYEAEAEKLRSEVDIEAEVERLSAVLDGMGGGDDE